MPERNTKPARNCRAMVRLSSALSPGSTFCRMVRQMPRWRASSWLMQRKASLSTGIAVR